MNEQLNERWYRGYQLAVAEPDSEKSLKLVAEVNLMLDARDSEITALRRRPTEREVTIKDKRQRWFELTELAADKHDPDKFTDLAREIDRLIAGKKDQLARA
jgi:hypothetical protein